MKTSVSCLSYGILLAAFFGGVQASDDDLYKSDNGPCCSEADGFAVSDPDWESKDGHYRVRVDSRWIDVPDDAVITEPSRAGRTMVRPIKGSIGPHSAA
jgi:hypothetical protein